MKATKTAADRPKKSAGSQHHRFIEAARKAECSKDEAVFDETLRRITKPAPAKPAEKDKK